MSATRVKKTARSAARGTYLTAKAVVIAILDDVTKLDLARTYGQPSGPNAKSRLYLDLGIPPERMAVMAPRFNLALRDGFAGASPISANGLSITKSIGEVISLFCKAAKVTVPPGEPT